MRLAFGEAVEVTATGVDIRFAAVEADSRCPIDVVCVWEGDAHVRIDLFSAGRRQSAGLHTSLEPKAVRYEGLTIRLVAVAPARTSTDTLRQQDYSIRLLIEQN